jgi:hypothetical protein
MEIKPVLLIVWAVLAACFGALLIYRSQLTRYEDEQLFLNEEVNTGVHEEQSRIVKRVTRLEPLVKLCGGAVGLMTASVVGIYVYNAWKVIQ